MLVRAKKKNESKELASPVKSMSSPRLSKEESMRKLMERQEGKMTLMGDYLYSITGRDLGFSGPRDDDD